MGKFPRRKHPKRPSKRYCLPTVSIALLDESIVREIPRGSRVIDLGCGDGRLLQYLRDQHACDGLGIELDDEGFIETIARGIPVIRGDLDHGLHELPDDAFDYAVLSQTLQQLRHPLQVLEDILRIARKALVVVPNFGHWNVRWQVLLRGRAPVTEDLPYKWYNTPNLHFMSMHDFRELESLGNFRIVKEQPIIGGRAVTSAFAANLRARNVLYVIERIGGVKPPVAEPPVSPLQQTAFDD